MWIVTFCSRPDVGSRVIDALSVSQILAHNFENVMVTNASICTGPQAQIPSSPYQQGLGLVQGYRFTVRVQSEMLSSSSRSGASFFIAHAWRLNVCLWVTTLVSLTPAKNCRFFQTRLGMILRWNSQSEELWSWPRWRLQTEALAYQDTVLTLDKQRKWRTLPILYTNFEESNWLLF